MITMTLLGSGGGMPMPDRFLSSMVLHYRGRKILIDCGEGTQVSMRKCKTGFKSIDIICITHLHGDHIFGLPGLLTTMGNSERTLPVTIIGSKGITTVIEAMMSTIYYLPFEIFIIENPSEPLFIENSSGRLQVDDCNTKENHVIVMSTIELDHSSPCLGFYFDIKRRSKFDPLKAISIGAPKEIWSRLQSGEMVLYEGKTFEPNMVLGEERKGIKISYITDTRPIEAISDFIRDSTLVICEGTYGDNEDIDKAIKNKHMTFGEAATLAREGNVTELLLTHFGTALAQPEDYSQNAKEIFENTLIGYDGFSRELTFD